MKITIYDSFHIMKNTLTNVIALNFLNNNAINDISFSKIVFSKTHSCLFFIESNDSFIIVPLPAQAKQFFLKQTIETIIVYNVESHLINTEYGKLYPYFVE